MAGLGDTVAELAARAWGGAVADAGRNLTPAGDFGPNPGALKAWVHIPQGSSAGAPLVVVLHGCGQTAAGYAAGAGWVELAERHGFALLCPEQARGNNPNLCFNWFEAGDIVRDHGEAASIAQMVRWAVVEHDLDPRRVFVTGLSAGGAMTAVMLATYPELFAAGAVVAGLPYGAATGVRQALDAMRRTPDLSGKAWGDKVRAAAPAPPAWPRISIWHGEADATVTPAAGDALVRQWCDVHGLARPAEVSPGADGRSHQVWRRPDGEVAVEAHRVAGLGHGTPIASAGVDGCGSPGPWILEAGVSSSLETARFWGLLGARRPAAPRPPPSGFDARSGRGPPAPLDVGATISQALRRAGLLR